MKGEIGEKDINIRDLNKDLQLINEKEKQLENDVKERNKKIEELEGVLEKEKMEKAELILKHEFELKEKDKENELKQLQNQLDEAKNSMKEGSEQMNDLIAQKENFISKKDYSIILIIFNIEEFQEKDHLLNEKDLKIAHLLPFQEKYESSQNENTQLKSKLSDLNNNNESLNIEKQKIEVRIP